MIALRRPGPLPPPLPAVAGGDLARRGAGRGPLRRGRALERRVASARSLGPLRPRLVVRGAPVMELDAVGRALAWRPSHKLVLAAVTVALALHLGLGSWSLGLRPHAVKAARVEMAVVAAADDVEVLPSEEPELPPPPPPERAPPSSAAASSSTTDAAPSPSSLAPGPIVPGLSPVPGAGGGLGVAVGSGGPPVSSSPPAGRAPTSSAKVEAPRPQRRTAPEYPRRARDKGVEGYVSLHILVDARGGVRDVRVLDAQPKGFFEEAALAAVRRWTFAPGRTDGTATDSWVRQVVRFDLD